MSMRKYKLFTILLPVMIIGGFEYIRHEYLLRYLTMEAGNFTITVITLFLSYLFASWMFSSMERSNEQILHSEARRAVFEERERLARELHDDLAQTLFFLNVKLRQGDIEEAKAAVSEIDNSLRQAIFNLRTPPEEGTSFGQRIQTFLANWKLVSGIHLQVTVQIEEDSFTPSEEVQLFGILQEAFTNIRKHSMATDATFHLEATPDRWRLHVTDNGCGMQLDSDTDTGNKKNTTYGIDLMQKRASELGAALELRSEKGCGTEVIVLADRKVNS
ncbi:ATP-binding protein [Paenibacillus qinlingensis]|uniref:histidine kinase n=1 Tax=Paenibacillus qinlingensis TaxID=1837343 RepID=A0ABU1P2E9_9BACL|nr:ATP-binding protein [Paenibacillus qinlingensis]MDR6553714.1 two-component system nitrate/nitrite sensor histidine kinase NarX [Paenibacillus qinlingensis]